MALRKPRTIENRCMQFFKVGDTVGDDIFRIENGHPQLLVSARFYKWRPQGDLNPCRRRERPVSWTRLDDGDETVSSSWWAVRGSNARLSA